MDFWVRDAQPAEPVPSSPTLETPQPEALCLAVLSGDTPLDSAPCWAEEWTGIQRPAVSRAGEVRAEDTGTGVAPSFQGRSPHTHDAALVVRGGAGQAQVGAAPCKATWILGGKLGRVQRAGGFIQVGREPLKRSGVGGAGQYGTPCCEPGPERVGDPARLWPGRAGALRCTCPAAPSSGGGERGRGACRWRRGP